MLSLALPVKLLLCAVAIRYFGVYSPLQKSMEYSVDTFKAKALGPGGMKHDIASTAQPHDHFKVMACTR